MRALTPAADGPGSVVQLADDRATGRPAAGAPRADAPASASPGAAASDNAAPGGAASDSAAPGAGAPPAAAVLGLDLGSTGSKGVLIEPRSGAVLADVYRRTDGNPVEAAKRLVADLRAARPRDTVVAVGLTGSGRDAVATVMRAAYPGLAAGLTVLNEIVAHAAAAVRFDPDGGRSLSIVEIGGQDAKFINVRDGRVAESDMNRVCSAGTGSFLEEQALAFGLDDIAGFGALAARSDNPPDLGQTCTVFVADVAAEALSDGFSAARHLRRAAVLGDQELHRPRHGRPPLRRARLLSGQAGREPLAGAHAGRGHRSRGRRAARPGRHGRPGHRPARRAASGAAGAAPDGAGAALPAAPAIPASAQSAGSAADLAAVDLDVFAAARVVERKSGRCGDRHCANLCRLETAVVEVAGERRRVVSGGNCPKYDDRSEVGAKLPKDAPNPYRERDELLAALRGPRARADAAAGPLAGRRIGLPQAHYLLDTLPFFAAFLAALGAEVEVLRPDGRDAGAAATGAARRRAPARRSRSPTA